MQKFLGQISSLPSLLTIAFIKVICNALCTSSRIKSGKVLKCFACGGGRDDLFHFLRCPEFCFIFDLPVSAGCISHKYFSVSNIAKLACMIETYHFYSRRFGPQLFVSSFEFLAYNMSYFNRNIASKNAIQNIAGYKAISLQHIKNC